MSSCIDWSPLWASSRRGSIMDIRYERSMKLFRRATRVIPGGIYGFKNPISCLPGASPYYAERAAGARFWDVDGNEYLDFLCGYGPVDYGYALTGHKAQGVTTSRTFTVITGNTDREWAYVALSRGRQANTLYLANPEPDNQECTHLTHPDRRDPRDGLAA